MPLADRLVHRLVIVEPTTTGSLDDYGQPVPGEPEETSLRGFLYPLEQRSAAREERQPDQAGAIAADHAIIILPREVPNAAHFRFDPDDGVRYEVVGVQPHLYGSSPLVQVLTRRIIPSAMPVAS